MHDQSHHKIGEEEGKTQCRQVDTKLQTKKLRIHTRICSDQYTVKKVIAFPVPSRDVTNPTLLGQEKLSLVSDIPANDGKIAKPFLQCKADNHWFL
jgi:hypothetical protein